jgi:hypothetical protein
MEITKANLKSLEIGVENADILQIVPVDEIRFCLDKTPIMESKDNNQGHIPVTYNKNV